MDKNKFYITTPIYYVNDIPHIGHAYTTIAADVLARYHRQKGMEVFFLTGTDEHGQKVEKAAKDKRRTPKNHADIMVENFKSLWKELDISNDAFIRTTDSGHVKAVQDLVQVLWDNGEIEKRQYAGWYCMPDERFWTEKDVVEGNCPDCGRTVEHIHEENYFFLMSKYQEQLIKYIEENPSYILPDTRRNEVLGFLKNNTLGDLCISRPKSRLEWGIPLPFDKNFVTYVWFDALVNYYSATKYLAPEKFDWWPADHHLVGKDILTTHAVYWSTMLMALKLPLPNNIFAHGWWTVDGKKMSKSLSNVVDPSEMVQKYGADAFRYFLLREVPFGLDGDFSEEALVKRINTDLANDIGNLLSRSLTMIEKYSGGIIPAPDESKDGSMGIDLKFRFDPNVNEVPSEFPSSLPNYFATYLFNLEFSQALSLLWRAISFVNFYIDKSAPWKEENKNALSNVLYNLAESLRLIAIYLYAFMPESASNIWKQLGMTTKITDHVLSDINNWGVMKPGTKTEKGEHLFQRIETEKNNKEKKNVVEKSEQNKEESKNIDKLISIGDFAKVQLKIGKVLQAERVPKSKKLLKLLVDTGETRQVVAGIGEVYAPEDLTGRKIVVVTNLKPAKLMGVESHGMLLAATDSDGVLSILMPEKDVKEGAKIK